MKYAGASHVLHRPKPLRPAAASLPVRSSNSFSLLDSSTPASFSVAPARGTDVSSLQRDEDLGIWQLAKVEDEMLSRSASCPVESCCYIAPLRPENPLIRDGYFLEGRTDDENRCETVRNSQDSSRSVCNVTN